jgi:hypothetical protein
VYVCSLHAESERLRIQLREKEDELKKLRLQLSLLSRGHAAAFNADSNDRTSVQEGTSSDSESSDDSESSESRELLGKFVQHLTQKVSKHPTTDECSSSSTSNGSSISSSPSSSGDPSGFCSSDALRSSCCKSSVKAADLNRVELPPSFQTIARQLTQSICKQARSEGLQDPPSASTSQPCKQPKQALSTPSDTDEDHDDLSKLDEPDGSNSSSSPRTSLSSSTFRGNTATVIYLNVCFNRNICMMLLVENVHNTYKHLTYKILLPSIVLARYFQVAACRQGGHREDPVPVQLEAQVPCAAATTTQTMLELVRRFFLRHFDGKRKWYFLSFYNSAVNNTNVRFYA